MKNLVRLSLLAGGLFLAGGTFAQQPAAAPAGASSKGPHDLNWRRLDLAALNSATKPTSEQLAKFKEIEAKYEKERHGLSPDLKPEERANQLKTMMMKRDGEVKAALTPEQVKQWEEALHTASKAHMEKAAPVEKK
ncbi:MAG: hypothetical protein QM724_08935 [Flavobacteriales bacterium]